MMDCRRLTAVGAVAAASARKRPVAANGLDAACVGGRRSAHAQSQTYLWTLAMRVARPQSRATTASRNKAR